jgi:hypothetical protein
MLKPTLVVYACHQPNENLTLFLKHGVFEDISVDFVVVCNNPGMKVDAPPYVKIMNRENRGHDFGAWAHGLLTDNLYTKYKSFICLNSTCMGPFVPRWSPLTWVEIFLSELRDTVHLVGPTINCIHNPKHSAHVQSYAFALTRPALDLLIERKVFSLTTQFPDKISAVYQGEVRMSREIISNGWNIAALMHYPRDIDWTFKDKDPEDYRPFPFLGDIAFPGQFYGQTPHPYECVFVKSNRGQPLDWLRLYFRVGNPVGKLVADRVVEFPIPSIDAQSC